MFKAIVLAIGDFVMGLDVSSFEGYRWILAATAYLILLIVRRPKRKPA
jgi:hypothetical protein